MMLIWVTFWVLLALTVWNQQSRMKMRSKSQSDWILDLIGLSMQGIVIPFLQITIVYQLYSWLLPSLKEVLILPSWMGFFLSFVLVDYLYYWNHRFLHRRGIWSIHQVHHTVTTLDVMGTSRNTLWTSFFILYLWVHPLFLYLLNHPAGYALGASLTAALDLWRHSMWSPSQESFLYRCLVPWLILPCDHAQHHARSQHSYNYGANLKLWDCLHGTDRFLDSVPDRLGVPTSLSLTRQLFWPFP
ncbi:MAG: sterol desaturase family protein [Leptolyngbyaceae cyanobacterium bins.59]|nr:sterol desaturase family protein [Leptolyngbyaceae cyanobacterium bins.59]